MKIDMELCRTFSERLGAAQDNADKRNDVLDLSNISSAAHHSFRLTKWVCCVSFSSAA